MKGTIVIVDDNRPVLDSLRFILKNDFTSIHTLLSPDRLPSLCIEKDVDVVLLDMNYSTGKQSGQEGLYWLNRIQDACPERSIVIITAYGDVDLAVDTLKRGAVDFVVKPWTNDKLLATVHSAYKLSRSKKEILRLKKREEILKASLIKEAPDLIGSSAAMKEVRKLISKVAITDANVLILGANGTGKELVARQIHALSKRCKELLLSVDLGALPPGLFESELFGHSKGAFTDARTDRAGKFEAASGGTLFLDEIGNVPLEAQAKLLAALQNREVTRLGSNKIIPVDIRLISATNKNPEKMVQEGLFREDLLYRLNTIIIDIPPLRQRGRDIILLASHFLKIYSKKYEKTELSISKEAEEKLLKHNWPGNVRELQHSIEKAVILCDEKILGPNNFSFRSGMQPRQDLQNLSLEEMEATMITQAIERCNGNMSAAAELLGISRQTLYNKKRESGVGNRDSGTNDQ
ncbi:MAG: sigma-54-dependent Fis family transcriptional regulator [Bacteroidetes bacterium]|nr:sigma-54-dependent Fis family transcriptional regulator [Bacteroidota bacterium]